MGLDSRNPPQLEIIMSDIDTANTPCSEEDRRTFFTRLTLGLGSVIATIVALPAIGFVLGPILRKPPRVWRSIGKTDDFALGMTVLKTFEDSSPQAWAGRTATTAAWVRREGPNDFIAFSINCRHLGCPVRWVEGSQLFMCPCHGGVYYKDGEVAAGPPPQGLQKYPIRIHEGLVEIETSAVPLPSQKSQDA
jgi:menaquinol-cytochrome c reductase iron-sulfur subunit